MNDRIKTSESTQDAIETMRRLEGIVASAMDGIITVNDAQRIILFNPAAERMFGLSASEAMGEPITRFIPERYRAAHAEHIHRFAETGVTTRQMGSLGAINGLRADGREFPIEASISQIELGDERLATVILRDITERKAAEDALVESQLRMEGIVESAMDALITIDDHQRIVLFNPAAEQMFGVSAAVAIGAPIESLMPERYRAGHAQHIARFKETGVTNRRMGALGAISGMRANGEEFPIEASISQVEVAGSTLATVILRDITERKANEDARNLLAREVDHRAKNALGIVQAMVSLTRAATKEEFVTAVRGRVSALGRAHSLLAQNLWAGAALADIIADEISPYERPGQVVSTGPGVHLLPYAVQPVSLLVHELATNALKHGALSVEEGVVNIATRIRPDHSLELSWIERGGPLASEPVSRGFGSTLVDQVATRQLGGTLDVRWPAEGMRLTVILPVGVYRLDAPLNLAPANDPRPEPNAADRRERVLVVEDESLLALELCNGLTALGWTVLGPAANIEEAVRILESTQLVDVAVLDVNLGGQLVYPLADRLRAQAVPMVFCTGYERVEERFRDCALVRKPVNVALLAAELRRAHQAA